MRRRLTQLATTTSLSTYGAQLPIFLTNHDDNDDLCAMAEEVEMNKLSDRTSQPAIVDDKPGGRLNLDANQEQAVTLWTYAATVMYVSESYSNVGCVADLMMLSLLVLATPMIFFPSLLLYVSETSLERRNVLTPLESFLSLHSGILLAAFALALLFNVRTLQCAHIMPLIRLSGQAPAGTAIQLPNQAKQAHPLLMKAC